MKIFNKILIIITLLILSLVSIESVFCMEDDMEKNVTDNDSKESKIILHSGGRFEACGSGEKQNVFIKTNNPSGKIIKMEGGEANLQNVDMGGGVEMSGESQMNSKNTLHHGSEEIFDVSDKAKLKMEESVTVGKINIKDEAEVTSKKSIHLPFVSEFIKSHKNTLSGRLKLIALVFGVIVAVLMLVSFILEKYYKL